MGETTLRKGELEKKYVVSFHNTFGQMLTSLKSVLPEMNDNLKTCFQYYKNTGRKEYIRLLENEMSCHIDMIIDNNEELFSSEYCPQKEKLELLPGLDFRIIWKKLHQVQFENRNELYNTKKAIFTYLRKLYLLANQCLQELDEYYKSEKGKSKLLLKLFNSFKMDREIKKKIREIEEQELNDERGMFGLDKISELLGDDLMKPIMEILDYVMSELKREFGDKFKDGANIQKSLMDLVSSERLGTISDKVGGKVKRMIDTGELDIEKIYNKVVTLFDVDKVKDIVYREVNKLNDPELKNIIDEMFKRKPQKWTMDDFNLLKERIPFENLISQVLESYGIKGAERSKIMEIFNQFKSEMQTNTT